VGAKPHWSYAVQQIGEGKLPSRLHAWPDEEQPPAQAAEAGLGGKAAGSGPPPAAHAAGGTRPEPHPQSEEAAEGDFASAVQLPTVVKRTKGKPKHQAVPPAASASASGPAASPVPAHAAPAAASQGADWPGLWDFLQQEVFDKPVQFSGCGSAASPQQGDVAQDLEILAEMVDLASGGFLVFWPPGLDLAAAKAMLASPTAAASSSQASTVAAPEDPELVLSSQELEHELGEQLTLEGWG
jgi:hypothetical protein